MSKTRYKSLKKSIPKREFKSKIKKINQYFSKNEKKNAADILLNLHPVLISQILEKLNPQNCIEIFLQLPKNIAADTLIELDEEVISMLLDELSSDIIASLYKFLDPDDFADILGFLEIDKQNRTLTKLEKEQSDEIKRLLAYPDKSAGSIMSPDFLFVSGDISLYQAIKFIRKFESESSFKSYVFILDDENKLIGRIKIEDLIFKGQEIKVKDIMVKEIIKVSPFEDQEKVANIASDYDLLAVPVVDHNNKLLGIITIDDLVDVAEEEAKEDIMHLGSSSADLSLYSSPLKSVRKRLPWLILNLCAAFISASVVAYYEGTIEKIASFIMFMPIIAGMGGNTGTQVLALIVRSFATGEVTSDEAWKVFIKQIVVGLILALIMGIIVSVISILLRKNIFLGFIIGLAIILNLTIASVMGVLIPFTLKKLKFDPAIASSTFLTTTTDFFGFLIYLGLCTAFIHYL